MSADAESAYHQAQLEPISASDSEPPGMVVSTASEENRVTFTSNVGTQTEQQVSFFRSHFCSIAFPVLHALVTACAVFAIYTCLTGFTFMEGNPRADVSVGLGDQVVEACGLKWKTLWYLKLQPDATGGVNMVFLFPDSTDHEPGPPTKWATLAPKFQYGDPVPTEKQCSDDPVPTDLLDKIYRSTYVEGQTDSAAASGTQASGPATGVSAGGPDMTDRVFDSKTGQWVYEKEKAVLEGQKDPFYYARQGSDKDPANYKKFWLPSTLLFGIRVLATTCRA